MKSWVYDPMQMQINGELEIDPVVWSTLSIPEHSRVNVYHLLLVLKDTLFMFVFENKTHYLVFEKMAEAARLIGNLPANFIIYVAKDAGTILASRFSKN